MGAGFGFVWDFFLLGFCGALFILFLVGRLSVSDTLLR